MTQFPEEALRRRRAYLASRMASVLLAVVFSVAAAPDLGRVEVAMLPRLIAIGLCLVAIDLTGLFFPPMLQRFFALVHLPALIAVGLLSYFMGSLTLPGAALFSLIIIAACLLGQARIGLAVLIASLSIFSLVFLAQNGMRIGMASTLPYGLGIFAMVLSFVWGLIFSRGERRLRTCLTESVQSLRLAQAEQEEHLRSITSTHLLLEEKYAETYALYLIEQEIRKELDEHSLLTKVVDIVLGLLGGKSCAIFIVDREHICLRRAAFSGAGYCPDSFPMGGNILGRALAENDALTLNDLPREERVYWQDRGSSDLICTPLNTRTERVGLILVEYDRLPESLDDHRRLLKLVAGQISLSLENTQLYERLRDMATHDALTGLWNRHYFQQVLPAEIAAAGRKRPLSAMILDVDHFKLINDAYGHEIGDEVLCYLGGLLREGLSENTTIARYGGEEFVMLLPGVSLGKAVSLAEQLRARIAAGLCQCRGNTIKVTVSLGVSSYPAPAADQRSLLRLADQALYLAKRKGRNKVAAAPEDLPKSRVTRASQRI